MTRWENLDLRNCFYRPSMGQLTVLQLIPKDAGSRCYSQRKYDAGRFARDPKTGRKIWWYGHAGCEDPVKLQKHYEIKWCALDEPDDFEFVK